MAPDTFTMNRRAFTLVEVMIVVLIVGILSAIAVPNFLKARSTARQKTCINNLKQLETAKEQWAMEKKKSPGDACAMTDIAGAGLHMRFTPVCPLSGTYTPNPVGTNATCSFSAAPESHVLP